MGWIDWAGMVFTFLSSYFLSKKMRVGWIFYLFSSVIWGVYGAVVVHSLPVVIMNVILLPNAIRGWRNWKKGEAL